MGVKMVKWIKVNGDIIECTAEEYKEIIGLEPPPKKSDEVITQVPQVGGRGRGNSWSQTEDEIVLKYLTKKARKEIYNLTGQKRSKAAIYARRSILKKQVPSIPTHAPPIIIAYPHTWSPIEDNIVTKYKPRKAIKELKKLGIDRTIRAIYHRRQALQGQHTQEQEGKLIDPKKRRADWIKGRTMGLIRSYQLDYERARIQASTEYDNKTFVRKDKEETQVVLEVVLPEYTLVKDSAIQKNDLRILLEKCIHSNISISKKDIWWKNVSEDEWQTFITEFCYSLEQASKALNCNHDRWKVDSHTIAYR